MDLSNKEDDSEQEISEMQFEEFALKTNVLAFANRSKAKAKPRRRTSTCSSTRTTSICERSWTDIAYPVSKQLSTLLRHGDLPREEDRLSEFWRLKDFLRNEFEHSQYWSDDVWKSKMAGGGGKKKIFQYCTDPSGQCINSEQFLRVHWKHRMCNQFTFHHKVRIDTGRTKFGTRLASYHQKKWKKHQNTVYCVVIKLAQQRGFKFYQTRSNAIILYDTLPAYCIPKAIMMESWEIIYEKVSASPRPPPKISFNDTWMKELGSEVAGGNEDSQQTQPRSKTQLLSTGRPVKSEQTSGSLTQEIEKDVLFGCESTNVSTRRPVKSCVPVSVERLNKDKDADENVDAEQISTVRPVSGQSIDLFTQREEIDVDFRVSGLPHAVGKQAENFRVHEPVKKNESHPHREALQADWQQNNVYNPFSDESKAMIREMGNVELFELCETIPKVQCSECLLYWNQGVIYCTCGHLFVESESSQNLNQWRLDAFSIPHYVIKKGRCSARQNRRTERACCGPQRAEEMYQKELWWNSRSFPTRSRKSWLATQNRLDRGEVHRNG